MRTMRADQRMRWLGATGLVVALFGMLATESAEAARFDINFSCTSGCVNWVNEPTGWLEVDDLDLGTPDAVVDIQAIEVSAFGLSWTELDASTGVPLLMLDGAGDAFAVQWQTFTPAFERFDLDADPRTWFCDFACSTVQPDAAGTYTLSPAVPEPSAALVFAAGLLTVAQVTRLTRR